MSSAGRAANSSGCVARPKAREIGLIGFAAQIRRSSLTGSYVMETAEHREPCESRGSRTVLGAPGGEIPPGDSTNSTLLAEATRPLSRKRCADKPWTEFKKSDATNLPYPDGSFDAAVSTQVYEYVADIPQALAELYRVIRPGGRVVVLDTDYDSLVIYTESQARMERVLSAWNEHF